MVKNNYYLIKKIKTISNIMRFLYSLSGDISFEKRLINEKLVNSDLEMIEKHLENYSLNELNNIIVKLKNESCYVVGDD